MATYGSKTSKFPAALASTAATFVDQDETHDAGGTDDEHVDGGKTNQMQAEIVAIQTRIGVDGETDAGTLTGIVDKNGFIRLKTSTDAAAPNNSIYYSSDQSKAVYKDGGGVVNDLY